MRMKNAVIEGESYEPEKSFKRGTFFSFDSRLRFSKFNCKEEEKIRGATHPDSKLVREEVEYFWRGALGKAPLRPFQCFNTAGCVGLSGSHKSHKLESWKE